MGAMAPPPPHWIPEDDVLLRNAVEAGASLESLAKGAVNFSRRFTVQELQDRWLSLLYDPIISIEASGHMIEVERSAFPNQLRPYRLDGGKEMACSSGKRKAESIRKCYYAMRKRISSEPFNMMGVNLLSGPGYSNFGDGNELSAADCRINNPVFNDLAIEGPDFDIRNQPFPEFEPHIAESTGNGVDPSFGGVQSHEQDLHLGGKDVPHNLSCPYKENLSLTEDCSEVPGFSESKDMLMCNFFETDGLVNEGGACSEFGVLPFSNFECSSTLPEMPTWHTSEEISAADQPIQIGENGEQTRESFMIPQTSNANESEALRYSGGCSNSKLKDPLSCDSMITNSTEDYLAELSSTLFDLADTEGPLFMDSDGKDAIEKSYLDGLSSLLLDSPNQSELPSTALDDGTIASDGHLVDTGVAQEIIMLDNKDLIYQQSVPDARVAASALTVKGSGPEYRNGVICCTLNTEDPEIPSNDDVFLPFRFPSPSNSSGAHWKMQDPSYLVSSSVKDFSSARKTNGGPFMMKNNQTDSCAPSRKIGTSLPSDTCLRYPIGDHGVKFELPKSNIESAALRNSRNNESANNVGAENVNANNFGTVKRGFMEVEQGKNTDYKPLGPGPDKHESGLNILQSLQKNVSCSTSGLGVKAEMLNNISSNADLSIKQTVVPKPVDQCVLSDQEELWSENDFEVPYFSDVEAMILDMDLSPDEFGLYTIPEVQRYQHLETKRTIIRLEQAADALTQRTIAGRGAFAVLSGRSSKYFIKKPEVLLGRATGDVQVDIDLGKEKNGSKISRRQAIIKMDMHGVFHLKNLGKYSIYVNGKEVAPGQSLNLTSGCLIEVRGLAFLFETDRTSVKQYVESVGEGGPEDHKLYSVKC